ncbi:alpha/beta hydrolase [Acinetobacter sp. C32I]|uniref:alpha/beta hydrolase n=1 Tax=Acinetobacter sp. C32I TaxID=2950074 RepID=UPI002036EE24|nr:alpha/beta hydrolase [Acinetobacter sp. C32I]USA52270.1 alpha/beta hydrolase [Acinetobacter sp. C32I]
MRYVHKELKPILEQLPELMISTEQMPAIRQFLKDHLIGDFQAHPQVECLEQWIPSQHRGREIRVLIYRSKTVQQSSPAVLWIHGGGYVMGTAEMDAGLCERFVLEAGCQVIAVDYRLAPEHPYPAALEDCYDSLCWLSENATALGIDAEKIAVVGASAGGGLTAALSLLARDRGGPKIAFQMPLYPMIDDRHQTRSSTEIQDSRVWNEQSNRSAWAMYLGGLPVPNVSSYAAPARAKDYSCLPPTYTCVGDQDPFRDETMDYVAALAKAGVPTEFHLYPGCFHGFDGYAPMTGIGQQAIQQYVQALAIFFHE